MIQAALWGLAGGSSLIVGAVVALLFAPSERAIGLTMAFGSGVLISAVAFDLTEEAFRQSGAAVVAAGLGVGAVAFFAADRVVCSRGGAHRKRSGGQQAAGAATAIVLGVVMDGVPESAAIGVSSVTRAVAPAVVAGVFLSNLPESLAASTGLRKAGRSRTHILAMWMSVVVASAVSAAAGFAIGQGAPTVIVAFMQTFAAGAILTMLADTMMPEAFEQAGATAGLPTALGFTLAFLLSATR